jgi:hypothetical protein
VKGERWLGSAGLPDDLQVQTLAAMKTLAKEPYGSLLVVDLSESLVSPKAKPFTFHLSRCSSHLPRPSIRQKAVHEQLERMIKHDWQENQTNVGTGAENQDR